MDFSSEKWDISETSQSNCKILWTKLNVDLRGKDEEYSSLIEDMQEEDSEFLQQEFDVDHYSATEGYDTNLHICVGRRTSMIDANLYTIV